MSLAHWYVSVDGWISSPFSPLTVLIFRLMLLRISFLAPLCFFLPSGPLPLLFLVLRLPLRLLFLFLLSSRLLSLLLVGFLLGFLGALWLLRSFCRFLVLFPLWPCFSFSSSSSCSVSPFVVSSPSFAVPC